MKRAVIRKLNSRQGASVLMALFAFVVATVVSTVLITAALTSANAARRQQEYTQAYLSVQSAATLLNSMANETGGSIRVTVEDNEVKYDPVNTVTKNAVQQAVAKVTERKLSEATGEIAEELELTVDSASGTGESADALARLGATAIKVRVYIPSLNASTPGNYDYEMEIAAVRTENGTSRTMASMVLHYAGKRKGNAIEFDEPVSMRE